MAPTPERPIEPTADQVRRAGAHGALGEPVRLSIVEDLARSDRSPGELAARFGLATNLVAHHLDVLESAGLIERFVSSGDRRRRYVRMTQTAVRAVAVGQTTGEAPELTPNHCDRVLFVCSANSARSQLAAVLWRARTGGEADCAGTVPAVQVHPGAIAAAKRAGLDLAGAAPRLLRSDERADLVITVCDRAHEELVPGPTWWHWSTPDPVAPTARGRGDERGGCRARGDAFDAALAQLDARIRSVAGPTSLQDAS